MATKPRPRKKSSADNTKKVVDAALRLAAERGWRNVSLADIAAGAKLDLASLYQAYPSKSAILGAYLGRIDEKVLAGTDSSLAGEDARDRLFDVIMRRFDAMAPDKEALRSISGGLAADPLTAVCMVSRWKRSLAWMLEAAAIETGGPRGRMRVRGLGLIAAATFRAWLRDETDDQSKTMAALDKGLRRAESCVNSAPFGCL